MASVGHLLDGKYQLLRSLGEGGMGAVFEATNTWTKRQVAIKTLHGKFASNKDLISRFWLEAQAASQIKHPNIVDVLDMGFDAQLNESFIVQEFLVGESLAERLARAPGRRLPPDEALGYVLAVAQALAACHRAGIIHRDIKPANIFLARDHEGVVVPKLIDFGISKIIEGAEEMSQTATGAMLGTPAYMSREQACGEKDIDARTDVWSLGVVLYEALCGQMPYRANNALQLVAKLLNEAPVSFASRATGLPPELVAIVNLAVVPERERRLPTMDAFVAALRGYQARGSTLVPPRGTPWSVRTIVGSALMLFAVGALGIGLLASSRGNADGAPSTARQEVVATPVQVVLATPPPSPAVPIIARGADESLRAEREDRRALNRGPTAPRGRRGSSPDVTTQPAVAASAPPPPPPRSALVPSPSPARSQPPHTAAPVRGGLDTTVHMDPFGTAP